MYKKICAIIFCVVFIIPFHAYANTVNISAQSAIAIDSRTNYILYERSADIRLPIASTTKIMTCILACELGNPDDVVTITDEMLYGTEGSLIYLKAGDKITLNDLIKGALLASGNDAANAIAVHIGKSISGFTKLMNSKAAEINMLNTHFETPSGLDAGEHYSTAHDMALLSAYAINNALFQSICSMQSAEITISNKTNTIYNHNKLLAYDENYVGIKTGYTSKAGRCLISAYNHHDTCIITVTLNAPDDWADHKQIKDYAIKKYKEYNRTEYFKLNVVGGTSEKINCGAKCKIAYNQKLKKKVYYYPFVYAPIYKGEVVGRIDFYSGDIKIESVEITASESVNLWQTTK